MGLSTLMRSDTARARAVSIGAVPVLVKTLDSDLFALRALALLAEEYPAEVFEAGGFDVAFKVYCDNNPDFKHEAAEVLAGLLGSDGFFPPPDYDGWHHPFLGLYGQAMTISKP